MSRILGVLGGMGPAATLGFLERLQALTPAEVDADHIRVIMDMNPHVPDRNLTPDLAGAELGRMAGRLKAAGAEVLAMPCNTAHAMTGGIIAVGLPFIDMIAETTQAALMAAATRTATRPGTGPDTARIGILATPGGEALYCQALKSAGLEPVVLTGTDRAAVMELIHGVKAGQTGSEARAGMAGLAEVLVANGAVAVIAGCTEVPLLLDAEAVSVPLVDSTEVLARACVAMCA